MQSVQAGGVGNGPTIGTLTWDSGNVATSSKGVARSEKSVPELPFNDLEDIPELLGMAPKQVHKVNMLQDVSVKMPCGSFTEKALPSPSHSLKVNESFTGDYFIALHNITAAPGIRADGTSYPAYTPNHIGARVSMPHVGLNLDRWRYHLTGYEDKEIVQLMEFGFPLGLPLRSPWACRWDSRMLTLEWPVRSLLE